MASVAKLMICSGFALAAALMVAPAAAQAGAKYVSMGSSYAAGPGVGTRDEGSGGCMRSLSNYARLLAHRRDLSLVDVACSGATTQDILSRSQNGFPPQIEAIDARTRLVTVTIGGNDVSYVGNLFGYSCRDTGGNCPVVSDADVAQRFTGLPDSLLRVIAEVHHRAPQAVLVLVGYLPVLPGTGPGYCEAIPLTAEDAARMRAVADRLARITGRVAVQMHTPIVSAWMFGAGHDACSAEPYMSGYKPALNPGWPYPVGYHPNQMGMDKLADAIDAALAQSGLMPNSR